MAGESTWSRIRSAKVVPLPTTEGEEPVRPDRCGTCRFWARMQMYSSPFGDCRKRAPVVTERPHGKLFPLTHSDDWCDEWQPSTPPIATGGPTP